MNAETERAPARKLRAYVQGLLEENHRLRGRTVPSSTAIELARENAHLRRSISAEMPRASATGEKELLTLHEVAQALGTSSHEVLRGLRGSLPLGRDGRGNPAVAREDVDAYLRARSEHRNTRRFL